LNKPKPDLKISVIMPVYNAGSYITHTINSVLRQTYTNWELIIVDGHSLPERAAFVEKYLKKLDKSLGCAGILSSGKIRFYRQSRNFGVASGRNLGVKLAEGRFIAFLDADDCWHRDKLRLQLGFMLRNDAGFCFTSYEFADAQCHPTGKKVKVPKQIGYPEILKNTVIFTSTVMFDLNKIGKTEIEMPNVPSEDSATWFRILRNGHIAYGLNRTLVLYRRSAGTLSSNKLKMIGKIWRLYRSSEELGIALSSFYLLAWAFHAALRRL